MIKEHIVGSLNIEKEDFDSVPFKPEGGLGKAYQLFGEDLWSIMMNYLSAPMPEAVGQTEMRF